MGNKLTNNIGNTSHIGINVLGGEKGKLDSQIKSENDVLGNFMLCRISACFLLPVPTVIASPLQVDEAIRLLYDIRWLDCMTRFDSHA